MTYPSGGIFFYILWFFFTSNPKKCLKNWSRQIEALNLALLAVSSVELDNITQKASTYAYYRITQVKALSVMFLNSASKSEFAPTVVKNSTNWGMCLDNKGVSCGTK